jgi:tetratricopeptide (TPR) repeat protein
MSFALYESGNTHFRNGEFLLAVDCYSDALKENCDTEMKVKLFLNRGQAYLKEREYESVVQDCSQAISFCNHACSDTSTIKAYIRRATAYEYLGDFKKALSDTESALSLEPPQNLLHTLQQCMPRLLKLTKTDQGVSMKEGCPHMLVTNHQTLRLVFMNPPPTSVVAGETFSVKMCIGNELGLWNRSLMDASNPSVDSTSTNTPLVDNATNSPVQLVCELIAVSLPGDSTSSKHSPSPSEFQLFYGSGPNEGQPLEPITLGSDGKVRT